jgi:hypothetical protein
VAGSGRVIGVDSAFAGGEPRGREISGLEQA